MTVTSTERLGSPFSPEGVFASGVRIGSDHENDAAKDAELRDSMKESGWLPGHPAIQDENGSILVGNRRMTVAKELGIRPDVIKFAFGQGDAGDIKRLKMALLSNVGNKPFSRGDRQAIASYLSSRGWTQVSIAEALGVAQRTISNDLQAAQAAAGNSKTANKPAAPAADAAKAEGARKRAPGAGRPKGSKAKAQGKPAVNPPAVLPQAPPQAQAQPTVVNVNPENAAVVNVTPEEVIKKVKLDVRLWPLFDQGLGQGDVIRQSGVSKQLVRDSRERHLGAIYGPQVRAEIGNA